MSKKKIKPQTNISLRKDNEHDNEHFQAGTLEDEAYNKHELYQIIFEFSIN